MDCIDFDLPSGDLDLQWLLQVFNALRLQIAEGFVITLPQGTGVRALNMEVCIPIHSEQCTAIVITQWFLLLSLYQKLIWDESLSLSAGNISARCSNQYSNVTELGTIYRDVLKSMGTDARVNVSDDATNILVGETLHIVENWEDANDAALQSINEWINQCDLYTFASDCNGDTQDPTSCRNCLQFLWRYVPIWFYNVTSLKVQSHF